MDTETKVETTNPEANSESFEKCVIYDTDKDDKFTVWLLKHLNII